MRVVEKVYGEDLDGKRGKVTVGIDFSNTEEEKFEIANELFNTGISSIDLYHIMQLSKNETHMVTLEFENISYEINALNYKEELRVIELENGADERLGLYEGTYLARLGSQYIEPEKNLILNPLAYESQTLTKEVVFEWIKGSRGHWEESHDLWDGSPIPYSNASGGWSANIVGSEYVDVEEGTYLCVVTGQKAGVDYTKEDEIFTFSIEKDVTTYIASRDDFLREYPFYISPQDPWVDRNLASLTEEIGEALKEESLSSNLSVYDISNDISQTENVRSIFLDRFKEGNYVEEMGMEHLDALCLITGRDNFSREESYDIFMEAVKRYCSSVVKNIETLDIDDMFIEHMNSEYRYELNLIFHKEKIEKYSQEEIQAMFDLIPIRDKEFLADAIENYMGGSIYSNNISNNDKVSRLISLYSEIGVLSKEGDTYKDKIGEKVATAEEIKVEISKKYNAKNKKISVIYDGTTILVSQSDFIKGLEYASKNINSTPSLKIQKLLENTVDSGFTVYSSPSESGFYYTDGETMGSVELAGGKVMLGHEYKPSALFGKRSVLNNELTENTNFIESLSENLKPSSVKWDDMPIETPYANIGEAKKELLSDSHMEVAFSLKELVEINKPKIKDLFKSPIQLPTANSPKP